MNVVHTTLTLAIAFCHIAVSAASQQDSVFRNALTKGADTRLKVMVVDECGVPVPDAKVNVTMADRIADHTVRGVTDTNGIFVVTGNTTGDYLQVLVAKNDHYDSWERLSYIDMSKEHKVANGKWLPFDSKHGIVLRRVRNPKASEIGNGRFAFTKQLGHWVGFDLQKHDFVHPHGIGEVADFEVKVDWDGKWLPEYRGMGINIRFTTPYSGYYELPVDPVSKLKGPYTANPDKTYRQSARFDERIVSPEERVQHSFDCNKCWIIRSRCKVDKDGKLITANYSVVHKITFCGEPDMRSGLLVIGAYNPASNDTNLEPKR